MSKDIWMALVQVEPINDNRDLGEAKGAYVNVAYRATSKNQFVKALEESFTKYDFKVLEIDDVERADSLTIDNPDNAEKLLLLKEVESESEFSWGDFHTYDE